MFGFRVRDESGNGLMITPDILTLFDGARDPMPSSGSVGSTYEKEIDLEDTYEGEEIGVLASPFITNIDLMVWTMDAYGAYLHSWFFHDNFDYFIKSETTGILSSWTPDTSSESNWDGLLAVFPTAFWDKRAQSSFDKINIFAGTCYIGYDQSTSSYRTVYTLGNQGVENVNYAIFLRHYKGE